MLVLIWKFDQKKGKVLRKVTFINEMSENKYIGVFSILMSKLKSDQTFMSVPFANLKLKKSEHAFQKHFGTRKGKLWTYKDSMEISFKIPFFFWIQYPFHFDVAIDQSKSENVLAVLFDSIISVLNKKEDSVIHKGSFLSCLESLETIFLESKNFSQLNLFYENVFDEFKRNLSDNQVKFITKYITDLQDIGEIEKNVHIYKNVHDYFLIFNRSRQSALEIYFSWLYTQLLEYLNSREIAGLDKLEKEIIDSRLFPYEAERALNILNARIKSTKEKYNLIPGHLEKQKIRFSIVGITFSVLLILGWTSVVYQRSNFPIQPDQLHLEIESLRIDVLRNNQKFVIPDEGLLTESVTTELLKTALRQIEVSLTTTWYYTYKIENDHHLNEVIYYLTIVSERGYNEESRITATKYLKAVQQLKADFTGK